MWKRRMQNFVMECEGKRPCDRSRLSWILATWNVNIGNKT